MWIAVVHCPGEFTSLSVVLRFSPYFVEPVIAGLEQKTNKPYIACMDLIGCPRETSDFVVSGTCSEQMYGMCESLWRPDLVSIYFVYIRITSYMCTYSILHVYI